MSKTVVPIWVFLIVAAAIALAAFIAGQYHQGSGVIVALLGSTLWTAYIARKGVANRGRNG